MAVLSIGAAAALPVGRVNLSIGPRTPGAQLQILARSPPSRVFARIGSPVRIAILARSRSSRAIVATAYDPNLLSDVVGHRSSRWSPGAAAQTGMRARLAEGPRGSASARQRWSPAPLEAIAPALSWSLAARAVGCGAPGWSEAALRSSLIASAWRQAPRVEHVSASGWTDAQLLSRSTLTLWIGLPLGTHGLVTAWRESPGVTRPLETGFRDAAAIREPFITRWRDAGYPHHWLRIRPPRPPPPRPAIPVRLCIGWPSLLGRISIGRGCRGAPAKRWYYVFNSASLVRLPDREPLPFTSLSISADADSWAWSLSATLSGANAFPLVAPQAPAYLPIEVEATVNGYVWQFLLDSPTHARVFARNTVTLAGRSRSAWLGAPFTRATTGANSNPTSAAQAAELALDNSGWSIDWSALPDWLIPAEALRWSATPIERLIQLARPVDGCLLTDPVDDLIRAYPRYAAPPWDWTASPPDHRLPESVPRALERQDDRRATVNGVYVGGTVAGVLAFAKVAGTAGDRLAEMVLDPLLCDLDGLAARARAVAILSAAGPGSLVTLETLLMPSDSLDPPMRILPGESIELNDERMLVRGTDITASWVQGRLEVWQRLTAESREVEA